MTMMLVEYLFYLMFGLSLFLIIGYGSKFRLADGVNAENGESVRRKIAIGGVLFLVSSVGMICIKVFT